MKFSIKDFFSKYEQVHSLQLIWLHLLEQSLKENFIFFMLCKLKTNTGNYWTLKSELKNVLINVSL